MKNHSRHQEADKFILLFVYLFLSFILALVFWYQFHTQLSWFAMKTAWYSLACMEFLHSNEYLQPIASIIFPSGVLSVASEAKMKILTVDPASVSFKKFLAYLKVTGYLLRVFIPVLSLLCIFLILKNTKAARMTRKMNLDSLIKINMHEFPQIKPAVIEKLLQQDPDKGPYRREESPIRFAIKNHLITAYKADFKGKLKNEVVLPILKGEKKPKNSEFEIEEVKDHYEEGISKLHNRCILNKQKTHDVFVHQLGARWESSDQLPPFIRGLYAALIAFASNDKEKCIELLDQFNRSWIPPKKRKPAVMDITGVDEVITKYETTPVIQKTLSRHAYVNTLLPSLLELARTRGKITAPSFLWLKVVDRTLWYSMHQEGGQTGWSEAAGPRAHKMAERAVKAALIEPEISKAVDAMEEYLSETEGWIPQDHDLPKSGVIEHA